MFFYNTRKTHFTYLPIPITMHATGIKSVRLETAMLSSVYLIPRIINYKNSNQLIFVA